MDVTEYRKGLRMQTDLSGSGITSMSMIVDAATGRVVMLCRVGCPHQSRRPDECVGHASPGYGDGPPITTADGVSVV
jgi:hypothetical protein